MAYIPDPLKRSNRARWQLASIAIALVVASIVLWKFTALAQLAEPARLAALLENLRASPWSAPAIVGLFIVGAMVLFPITALFVVSAAILEPPLAILTSLFGALSSAMVGYGIGAKYFRNTAATAGGWRMARVQELLRDRGILAIAMARFIPVAPYLIFNIAAGAVGVRIVDFLVGTALALLPVILVLTLFEAQVRTLLNRPSALGFTLLAGLIVLWVVLLLSLRRLLVRKARPPVAPDSDQ